MFAVEFTDMANHARRLVAKNGMEDVVEVIQCSVEDLELDGKVRNDWRVKRHLVRFIFYVRTFFHCCTGCSVCCF